MLVVAPLMHGNAQWVMWNAFMMGATAVLYTDHRYDPDALWRLVGDEGVVSMGLVGDAMARPLADALATAAPGTYDTSTLAVVGSGGAMLTSTVKDELKRQLPERHDHGPLRLQRERGPGGGRGRGDRSALLDERRTPPCSTTSSDRSRPGGGAIGRLARTGRIPLGYYKDPVKTEATFPVDADGVRWSVPGDLASVEADGTIVVHGRGSASINSGGEKIFPEEVEAAVKSHPDVFDAIVVGIPDDRFGERVAVAVQVKRRAPTPSLDDLQYHCRSLLAGYKLPRQLAGDGRDPPDGRRASPTPRRPRPCSDREDPRHASEREDQRQGRRSQPAAAAIPRASTRVATVAMTRSAAAINEASSMATTRVAPASGHTPTTRAGTGREGDRSAATNPR